ncbi:type IV secretion protein IcmC [Legionella nagasakiensis]|uniref:type IV secretion protein IcmC n=1 Tax=Legionella nagasakiensis TaxID=535290 RepID=UPI001054CF0B|nr:type IV secretion protein IcmC [Legionella nagasakiensis]
MNVDIVEMIGNLSQSLIPVQALVSGLGYLLGLLFMITAIGKLRKIGDARARGGSHEKMFVPLAYLMGGTALIFLPSAVTALSTTAFGSGNTEWGYSDYNPYDIYSAMRVVIRVAGLIWFVRGCVLLVHASEPGVQHGPKGLTFLCAGVLAINFEGTVGVINYFINRLISLTQSSVSLGGG